MQYDLSVLIPSRREMFLAKTIDDILGNAEGKTEVIAVLDGEWSEPPISDHPDVTLVYLPESIGQRAACNLAAKLSKAKYIMKGDGHMAFDKGFDIKAIAPYEDGRLSQDTTTILRMYNLHVFDWKCNGCGHQTYQGPTPTSCPNCDNKTDFERVMVWQPRRSRMTDFTRIGTKSGKFDPNLDEMLRFQYWGSYKERPAAYGDIVDVMGNLGACWFMPRERYWEIGGLDENHGSWGQMGVEIACKSWLSGGRQVVNKTTWFSHMFRTQGGDFGFPYPLSGKQVSTARKHSMNLWLKNEWPKSKHRFSWLINKFNPPGWPTKGIVYYTDSKLEAMPSKAIANAVRGQIDKSELPVVSVSLEPLNWGRNVHLDLERGYLTMFKQILAGLEASDADVIFLCEHDVLYHPSHFDFIPPNREVFYYNMNCWKWEYGKPHFITYDCKQTSQLCGWRKTLIEHYKERVRRVELEGFSTRQGFEPGSHRRPERIDDRTSDTWRSAVANIDIRHAGNLTPSRWRTSDFRSQKNCRNWKESSHVPGWAFSDGYILNAD